MRERLSRQVIRSVSHEMVGSKYGEKIFASFCVQAASKAFIVPKIHKEDDFRLGIWISNQRKIKDNISPERIERLDDLGFIWSLKSG